MIPISDIYGDTYWINPRHITQMMSKEVTNWMYKNCDLIDGVTRYVSIMTSHGLEYDVNATVEELLELMKPYLG